MVQIVVIILLVILTILAVYFKTMREAVLVAILIWAIYIAIKSISFYLKGGE